MLNVPRLSYDARSEDYFIVWRKRKDTEQEDLDLKHAPEDTHCLNVYKTSRHRYCIEILLMLKRRWLFRG